MVKKLKANLGQSTDQIKEPVIACSPGKQPLWRYLVSTCENSKRGKEIVGCQLLSWPEPANMVNAFVAGDLDAFGLIGSTFLRLRERVNDSISMFQPITWMTHGPVLCTRQPVESMTDLKGQLVASSPLASDLMAYWQSLFFENNGYHLKDFFTIKSSSRPEQLLENGHVLAAFVSGYTWAKIRGSGFSIVTDMRTEWDRVTGIHQMPVMGGLVARSTWLEQNGRLQEALSSRLREGFDLYRNDKDTFLLRITSWDGIAPELIIDKDEAAYWCRYWGMDQLTENRLTFSTEDKDELALLERLMHQVNCI